MILVPLFCRWMDLPEKKAFATSVAVILPMCIVSAIVYLIRQDFSLLDALPFLIGGLIGGLCGLLGLMQPSAVGGGFNLIPIAAAGNFSVGLLLFIFIARVVTTLICFSSGAPGGIFAPMLALGTLLGTAFGMAAIPLFPAYHLDAGTFAIAGMGALLAASVRAPLTGIVLVLEMTDNYQLILPMIITCLGATLLAQFLGGKPLYSTILQRTLAKQEAEQAAKAQQAPRENT